MKGIEKYERDAKRGNNLVKQEVEAAAPAEKKKESKKVVGHSNKKIGSFFTALIDRTKDWMSDDIE
jgi:hypothetical protein